MKSRNGGPAFPSSHTDANSKEAVWHPGMTVRDQFAMHEPVPTSEELTIELAEHLMGSKLPSRLWGKATPVQVAIWWAEADARYRYMRADAMLKARE